MEQNAGNFTLSFQQVLETNQLVRHGRSIDPLGRVLRAVAEDQYGNLMAHPNANAAVPKVWDFRINSQGMIVPELSTGKPDKIHSNCRLPRFVDELIAASCMRVTVFVIEIIYANIWSCSRSLFPKGLA